MTSLQAIAIRRIFSGMDDKEKMELMMQLFTDLTQEEKCDVVGVVKCVDVEKCSRCTRIVPFDENFKIGQCERCGDVVCKCCGGLTDVAYVDEGGRSFIDHYCKICVDGVADVHLGDWTALEILDIPLDG